MSCQCLDRQGRLAQGSLLDLGDGFMVLAQQWVRATPDLDPALAFYVEHLQAQAGLHPTPPRQPATPLKEALSEREQEILRALASVMSNKHIARALGVSPETVKWHLKNVYSKLGVTGRDDAVARARDLRLVGLT